MTPSKNYNNFFTIITKQKHNHNCEGDKGADTVQVPFLSITVINEALEYWNVYSTDAKSIILLWKHCINF